MQCMRPKFCWINYFVLLSALSKQLYYSTKSPSWWGWDWANLSSCPEDCIRVGPKNAKELRRWMKQYIIGPIANLKGPYFQPSLSVCVPVYLWLALLPFNVTDFDETPFWKFQKNSQKSQNSNFKIQNWVHHFLHLCLLCIVNKKASIRWQDSARRQF